VRAPTFRHGRTPRLILLLLLRSALAFGLTTTGALAQTAQPPTGTVRIEISGAGKPVDGATVSAGGRVSATDASGVATLELPSGLIGIIATKEGYEPRMTSVLVVAGGERAVRMTLTLSPQGTGPPHGTIIASTRTHVAVDAQAVPIEILGRDRLEENMLRTPGTVVTSLGELVGVRSQTTSPELGLAAIRIHGLPARYTRLLADGVPLYFDLPGGLAPVQIPPMDLDRVELITESASALFGANAVAGAVNLLSRRPGTERNREFLVNQSTLNGTDGVLWLASPSTGSWSGTTLLSAHRQDERDGDDDGWSDLPGYNRGLVRQRLYWNNRRGKALSGTAGVTFEKRKGGSAIARQQLETKIADGALFGQMPLGPNLLAAAGSLYVQSRVRDFSDVREHDRRESATLEISLRGSAPRQSWVAGIAADWFAIRTPDPLASASVAPRGGVFVHDDVRVTPWLIVSGSARIDYTKGANEARRTDDFFFSPRGSALARKGAWAARVSAGRSYFVPTPLTEETEAAGFTRLTIEGPIEVETARSMSADLTYHAGAAALTVSLFQTRIDDPAVVDRTTYTLHTGAEPLVTEGAEVSATVRRAPFSATARYMYVKARDGGDRDLALTPRHTAGVNATIGSGRGRIGVNVDFTGVQQLDSNPYRSVSEAYALLGVLGERRFGRYRLFVNADNLTDVRQTDWDPIARPSRDLDGRWTVDAWAPLQGRVLNAGIRIAF
jgi:outer membrane receptor for ferrienterochelin and colicins